MTVLANLWSRKSVKAGSLRFKPGDQPAPGDWELVELLGRTSFGEVWKAQRRTCPNRRPAVLKFCLDPNSAQQLRTESALRELGRVQAQGGCRGIVPLLEMYLEIEPPCLVYEHIEGGDLTGLLKQMQAQGRLTPSFAIRIIHELASTMARFHRLDPPLIHHRLKLSNILVQPGEGDNFSLRVADFGVGKLAARLALQEQAGGQALRSRLHPPQRGGTHTSLDASPQQLEGGPPDPRDDVHALGVLWYQSATGALDLPSIPPDWRDVAEEHGLEENQIRLLASCLASRVEKRPSSAVELAERLAALLAPTTISIGTAQSPGTPPGCDPQPPPGSVFPDKPAALRVFPGKTEPQAGEVATVSLGAGVEMKFAWVPPGTFLMGSPDNESWRNQDEEQHPVTLTRGFWSGVTPVTQAQWRAVLRNNPSRFKGAERPVETVAWVDCVDFCKRLQQQSGKRFRLPTEAEWEYACRAGAVTAYHSGDGLNALMEVGWCSYDDNQASARETKPVGQFAPNAWGLHDMHGNVWEWCHDRYGLYENGNLDPMGPGFGDTRVLRGGSWHCGPQFCRSARRARIAPVTRYVDFGCRIVLCPE